MLVAVSGEIASTMQDANLAYAPAAVLLKPCNKEKLIEVSITRCVCTL